MLKTSHKLTLTIFVLIFLGLSAYGFFLFRERNSEPKIEKNIESQKESTDAVQQDNPEAPASDNSAVDSDADVDEKDLAIEENNFLDISKEDCTNNCKDFTDQEDLIYCQQICNITPIRDSKEIKKGCDALKELEKDYCLKDLAITTKNMEICLKIEDSNILKICKNRVAEDLIEKQIPQ